jgi:hypothetical protein
MATKRRDYPIEPMTLGNMRDNGVRSLDVSCWQCHHRAILRADPWSDDVPVPTFGPRMVCTRCGISRRAAELERAAAAGKLDRSAMAMSRDQRRALELLADSPDGCTMAIMRAGGIKTVLLNGLVREGSRRRRPETCAPASGRPRSSG